MKILKNLITIWKYIYFENIWAIGFSNNISLIQPLVKGIHHKIKPMPITIKIAKTIANKSFLVISANSFLLGLSLYKTLTKSITPAKVPSF